MKTNGIPAKGKDRTPSYATKDIDPFRAYDFIDRYTSLGNTLRFRATILPPDGEGSALTARWQPNKNALLRLQDGWRNLILLSTKLPAVYTAQASVSQSDKDSVRSRFENIEAFFNDSDKRKKVLEGDLSELNTKITALDSLHNRVRTLLKEEKT